MTTSPSSSTSVTVTVTGVSSVSAGPVSSEALLAMALMTMSCTLFWPASAAGVAVLSPATSLGFSKSGASMNLSTPSSYGKEGRVGASQVPANRVPLGVFRLVGVYGRRIRRAVHRSRGSSHAAAPCRELMGDSSTSVTMMFTPTSAFWFASPPTTSTLTVTMNPSSLRGLRSPTQGRSRARRPMCPCRRRPP